MEYGFLYDKASRLLCIGYNVDERRRDASYYDLLASEARLCVFVAIAQGQLPQESWFALGRLLTSRRRRADPAVLERLDVRVPDAATGDADLRRTPCSTRPPGRRWRGRSSTASSCGLPWGMSESGYNTVDVHLNYQYRAFGVPGLGLKRGLAEDLVVAPYATVLALMVAPEAACLNLQRLAAAGAEGRFGFHEAIDYTPARQRRGEIPCPGALLHGPSPGHEPARPGLSAAGPPDAETLCSPTRCSRPPCCCCRSASPGPRRSMPTPPS